MIQKGMPIMILPKTNRGTAMWCCSLLAAILFAPGCSDSIEMGDVSGTIRVDGQPAKTGAIAFFPVDGKSPTAGAEIRDGHYEARVPLGQVKVEIRVSKVVGHKKLYDAPNSPIQPILEEVLPDRYNNQTELTLDIQSGANPHDFDLKSQ